MYYSAILQQGAQSLMTSMASDAWSAVRDFLARRFGHGDHAETERMSRQLEVSRGKALTLAGDGADGQILLMAYWAGYLDGMLTLRPDMADAWGNFRTVRARTRLAMSAVSPKR
ncbi:hypothetical protein [Catenulispora rubra]|uniref:hypothetical protein n=1 Tax=Catenulispora rubra TaxID=280293 RepID=UPI0018922DFD|nr:hypothetical protein [Catenulispora rubra]